MGSQAQQAGRSAAKQAEEPFYGFSEFFRDVEGELGSRRKRAASREAGTLLEELAAIGEDILEDLVEFLETELGLQPEKSAPASAALPSCWELLLLTRDDDAACEHG